jgi:hypothetical protein
MNKRFQILCLVFVGMVFQANESKAITNGDLYKACKSYTEAGFKIRTMQHTLCMAYIRGLLDMQSLLCQSAKLIDEKDVSHWLKSFGTNFYAAEQLDAIVQSYVNHMTSHPEEWQDSPHTYLVETSLGLAPCK